MALKCTSVYVILRMSYGSEFQAVGPVTENAHSPSLDLVGGTVYDSSLWMNVARVVEMVWYGMVNVDLYSAIITKVSNALRHWCSKQCC